MAALLAHWRLHRIHEECTHASLNVRRYTGINVVEERADYTGLRVLLPNTNLTIGGW